MPRDCVRSRQGKKLTEWIDAALNQLNPSSQKILPQNYRNTTVTSFEVELYQQSSR